MILKKIIRFLVITLLSSLAACNSSSETMSKHEQEMNEADYVISVVAGNPSENLINSNSKFFTIWFRYTCWIYTTKLKCK